MDMHPTLTTVVYSLVAFLLISVFVYMILYTRGLHTKRDTLEEKHRLPVCREEGIAVSTLKKEHDHRTGTVT
jgi:hypothetical protein